MTDAYVAAPTFIAVPRAERIDDVAWALKTICDGERMSARKQYSDYYNGKQDMKFATVKFNQAFGGLFKTLAYNRCRPVVSAHTDRLYVESFDAGERQDLVDRAEELWGVNRMDETQLEVHRRALIYGDAYLYVWRDPSNERPVVMWPQSSLEVTVRYDEDDPTRIELAAKVWRDRWGYTRCTLYYPDRFERWISVKPSNEYTVPKPADMMPFTGDDEGSVIDNPYGRVPMFPFFNHGSIGDSCGVSELDDVIPLQNAMNKTLADEMVTEEFMAYPQRVIIGLDSGPSPYTDQSRSQLEQDATLNKFAVGLMRIMTISDPNAKVEEFSPAQLKQFTEMAEFWDRAISRTSRVPVHYLTLSGDFPSGRALRTAESPFVAKLEAQQRNFGNSWEDAMRFAIQIADGKADLGRFSAKWRTAAPMAKEDEMDLALQMVALGIPLDIALADIGWSSSKIEEVMQRREEEQDAMLELMSKGADAQNNAPSGDTAAAQNATRSARRGSMRVVA